MSRIAEKFDQLRKRKKKALIIFVTAGDPGMPMNEELVECFEKDGVDIVELGVPFSDPLADGPVIQASSQRSLRRGTNLKKILVLAKNIRVKSQIPLVLMSYLNPILSYGLERFAKEAAASGIDGVILPDVPVEEGAEISKIFRQKGLDLIYLAAPTSNLSRKKKIATASTGFIYFVSMTGVTGTGNAADESVAGHVRSVKKMTRLPVCVGFGISTPEQARRFSKISDGVIVGSAIVSALNDHPEMSARDFSRKFIRPLAKAVKGAI